MKNASSSLEDSDSPYEDSDIVKGEDEDDQYDADRMKALKPKPTRTYAKNPREFFARKLKKEQEDEQTGQDDPEKRTAAKPPSAEEFEQIMNELIDNPVSFATAGFIPLNDDDPNANSNNKKQLSLIRRSIREFPGNSPDATKSRDECKTDMQDLVEAVYCFGFGAMKPEDNSWRFKEMKSTLMPFQLAASKWMLERECTPDCPSGGILAYGTGLGKSIISLACILGNRPDKIDLKTYAKSTLVVVPNQKDAFKWENEVERHCKAKWFDATVLYEPGKLKALMLRKSTIVSVIALNMSRLPFADSYVCCLPVC